MKRPLQSLLLPGAALLLGALLAAPPAGAGQAVDGKAAFESLKKLAGDWQGRITTPDGKTTTARYELISGGTAVMETVFAGTSHEMRSVYHLDGADLVLTHYCATGNQPRMKLDPAASTPEKLVFQFAGGSNMDPAKDGHIHGGRLVFAADGKVESEWDFYQEGKQVGTNKLFLTRDGKP